MENNCSRIVRFSIKPIDHFAGGSLEKADKNAFGSLLTSIGLKIMLDVLPDELQDLLLNSIDEFNKINNVVSKLTGKKMPLIQLEKNRQNKVIDIIIS
jgi:hypothetical protein